MDSEISFIEIGSGDASTTSAFLARLFGWDFHVMGQGPEGWFQMPAIKAGMHGKDLAPSILVFFHVADMNAAVARVKELGGEASDPVEEQGFGHFSMCRDPSGVPFGLHQI